MSRQSLLSVALSATLIASGAPALAAPATDARTQAVAQAGQAFLEVLTPAQRAKVEHPFVRPTTASLFRAPRNPSVFVGEQYGQAVWSNFPTSDVTRPGVALGELTEVQRGAAMALLRAVLSADGYQKVVDIMDSDQVLSESGTPYDDGRAFYYLALFGRPSATEPWMLQFGGHHLGLNIAISGPNVTLTPTLTGDQPATFVRDGRTIRPLGDENDKAFRLMDALSAGQRAKATLTYDIRDLVLGPGHDGQVLQPEGLAVAEMTEAQRGLLLDLIGEWVGMLNADDAAPKLARIKAELAQSHFAWHGPTSNPSAVYFRITGPSLHIEFAHQGTGNGSGIQAGGPNHVHTVYRDPTNAYGAGRGR